MSKGFNIELSGLDKVLRKLQTEENEIVAEVDAEMGDYVNKMRTKAVSDVPVDNGFLKNSISVNGSKLSYELVAQSKYAPYIEFGTKTRVKVPKGLEDYAIQFWSGKRFDKGGIKARPFFFPAIFTYRRPMIEAIIKVLRRK